MGTSIEADLLFKPTDDERGDAVDAAGEQVLDVPEEEDDKLDFIELGGDSICSDNMLPEAAEIDDCRPFFKDIMNDD